MYCSSCGAESIKGLQYCKRCGANLIPAESSISKRKPKGLTWIVAFGIAMMMGLPLGGIAVVVERIRDLLEKGFPLWFLLPLAIVSLLMVFVAMVLLSRLLSPLFKTYLQSGEGTATEKPTLNEPTPAQIDAPGEFMASVTEETTRAFEPIHVERDTH